MPAPRTSRRPSQLRRSPALLATAVAATLSAATTATADPVRPPKTFQFALTCTGIGDVLATNIGPSHAAAFQVVGTDTVLLPGLTGQFGLVSPPGVVARALAAGTTCTLTAGGPPGSLEPVEPPVIIPYVIVHG